MKALIVTAHPRQDSFTRALAERFAAGVMAAGHEIETADLYGEGFDPIVSPEEMDEWQDGRVFPAILTGWLQRVFTRGFAFRSEKGHTEGLLKLRAQLLVNIGSRQRQDVDLTAHYLEPMAGVLAYCGMDLLPTQANWGVYPHADPEALQVHLDRAFENGKRFFA